MPLCVPLLFPFLSFERCWPTLLFCNELLCVSKNIELFQRQTEKAKSCRIEFC